MKDFFNPFLESSTISLMLQFAQLSLSSHLMKSNMPLWSTISVTHILINSNLYFQSDTCTGLTPGVMLTMYHMVHRMLLVAGTSCSPLINWTLNHFMFTPTEHSSNICIMTSLGDKTLWFIGILCIGNDSSLLTPCSASKNKSRSSVVR